MILLIIETVLAGLAVLIVAFGSVGALLAREPLAKLHFLAPVTSLAAPLFAVAAMIYFGFSLGSAAIVLIALVVAFSGPAVTIAIARTLAAEEDLDAGTSPQ